MLAGLADARWGFLWLRQVCAEKPPAWWEPPVKPGHKLGPRADSRTRGGESVSCKNPAWARAGSGGAAKEKPLLAEFCTTDVHQRCCTNKYSLTNFARAPAGRCLRSKQLLGPWRRPQPEQADRAGLGNKFKRKLVVPKSPAWPRGASSPSSPVPQILRIFASQAGRTTTSPLLRPCRRWKRGSCAVERLQGSLNHVQGSPGCSHALLSSSRGGQGTCRRQENFWSSFCAMGGVFGDLRG